MTNITALRPSRPVERIRALFRRRAKPEKPEPAHVKPMVKAAVLNIAATSNTRGRL